MSAPVYVPLRDIARVCVLTEHTLLTRHWPAHWGVPRDWRLIRSAVIVNVASLPDLAKELAENGEPGTAGVLQKWIDENAAEAQLADFTATRAPSQQPARPADRGEPWWKKGQFA